MITLAKTIAMSKVMDEIIKEEAESQRMIEEDPMSKIR